MQYIFVQITFFFTLTVFSCSVYAEADDDDVRNGGTPYVLPLPNEKRPLISSIETNPRRLSIADFFSKPSSTLYPASSYEEINDVRRRCPLCDSSVYSYCSEKLLHDACCCNNPYDTSLPYQCRFADCSFLHANSCKEHRLITACCCTNLLYKKNQPIY